MMVRGGVSQDKQEEHRRWYQEGRNDQLGYQKHGKSVRALAVGAGMTARAKRVGR